MLELAVGKVKFYGAVDNIAIVLKVSEIKPETPGLCFF